MLRGHVARQRSGRRRVLSSINVGAARLHVRFGPVAYVISHRQRVSAWAGSGGQGPDTCQHRTPAHTRVLLVPGPCWGSDLPGGSELICVLLCGGPDLLGCVVFSCHVTPFGLPMRRGQAPSPAWLGDVAWVQRLHAVEEGTPDLGYRQHAIALCGFRYGDIHYSCSHFYYQFIIHCSW
jgi:hypothetical protein